MNNIVSVRLLIEDFDGNLVLTDSQVMMEKEEALSVMIQMNNAVNRAVRRMISPVIETPEQGAIEKAFLAGQLTEKQSAYLPDPIRPIGGNNEEPVANKVEEYSPFSDEIFTRPKLVAFRCFSCGEITVRNKVLAESRIDRCRICKDEIEIKEVVKADIQCPSCSSEYYIYTANGLKEITCRSCQAPIDITYHEDGKKAASANIARW